MAFNREVAQGYYQRWLKLNGIHDSNAHIEWHPQLGYVGIVGEERRKRGLYYERLPEDLIVEINRASSGFSPLDAALVKRLMQQK